MLSTSQSVFLVLSAYFTLSAGHAYDWNPDFKQIGPNELTDFLIDRLGGFVNLDFKDWNKRSDDEVKDVFVKHSLKYFNPVPCQGVNCVKNYTDDATGSAKIDSRLTDGNRTVDATSQIDAASSIQFFMSRDAKEEAHCLVASVNSTFENQGDGFDYTVSKNVTYGGGVRIQLIMDSEPEFKENPVKLHILKATSKSELEEITASANYFDKLTKVTQVSATVVTFDTENCDNAVDSFECDTLARIYHHIKSFDERTVTYKGKTKSYKADSSGTIITVVKKA